MILSENAEKRIHNFLYDWKKEYDRSVNYIKKFIHSLRYYKLKGYDKIILLLHFFYDRDNMEYGFLSNDYDFHEDDVIILNFSKSILKLDKIS